MSYRAMSKLLASAIVLIMALPGVVLSAGCGDASASSPPPATPTTTPTNSAAPTAAAPSSAPAPAGGGW
jgi:hypothetical protein